VHLHGSPDDGIRQFVRRHVFSPPEIKRRLRRFSQKSSALQCFA
jgi:hypothetical protein